MHYAPCFVIPRGLSTLYRCSLTTVAQDKPYHEKPLIRDCFNHKGSCTLFRPYLTIAAGISSSSFVRVSTRQLAVSSLSKGISSTLIFHELRALVLTGLELATSRTQSERRIDWSILTTAVNIHHWTLSFYPNWAPYNYKNVNLLKIFKAHSVPGSVLENLSSISHMKPSIRIIQEKVNWQQLPCNYFTPKN